MTGWRIGYACGSAPDAGLVRVHQYTVMSSPTIAQIAAIRRCAMDEAVMSMLEEYDRRRRLIVPS